MTRKIVPENKKYNMSTEIPYDGAKPIYFVEDVDNKELLADIVSTTTQALSA